MWSAYHGENNAMTSGPILNCNSNAKDCFLFGCAHSVPAFLFCLPVAIEGPMSKLDVGARQSLVNMAGSQLVSKESSCCHSTTSHVSVSAIL
jgi:hypothetical protein